MKLRYCQTRSRFENVYYLLKVIKTLLEFFITTLKLKGIDTKIVGKV